MHLINYRPMTITVRTKDEANPHQQSMTSLVSNINIEGGKVS